MRLPWIVKATAVALAALVGVFLALEAAFRVAGLWVGAAPRADADGRVIILCVGDSHTRGQADPDNYPASLERLLEGRTGRAYRVINLGIPAQNTTQVRHRFERYLDYYRPALVLHWAGINNFWNGAETDETGRTLLTRFADSSRVIRLFRVARFYHRLEDEELRAAAPEAVGRFTPDAHRHVRFGGLEEDLYARPGANLSAERLEKMTRDDLTAMMQMARARHIPMYLITYPIWLGKFLTVNTAIQDVSKQFGVPFIDSANARAAAREQGPGDRLFDSSVHPTPWLYWFVAEEAYRVLAAQGEVAPPEGRR